jgi:conjugal transfer pilus assembly protein TraK
MIRPSFLLPLWLLADLALAQTPELAVLPTVTATHASDDKPEERPELALPAVNADILKRAENPPAETSLQPQSITVQPGINELIPIAIGHLNRLVTPFEHPLVTTTSQATTSSKGAVVYVATQDETPVTLYLTPGDRQEMALSLTLIPKRIPAREIRLTLDASAYQTLSKLQSSDRRQTGSHAQTEQPHVLRLKQLYRDLARGITPEGFELREPFIQEKIDCHQPALMVRTRQVLEDADTRVLIGKITNHSGTDLTFNERWCANQGEEVLAVAVWPKAQLTAHESAEVYVTVSKTTKTTNATRPSLLNGDPEP